MPLSRLSALIKDLFSSSEISDVEMEETITQATPTLQEQIRSAALANDLTAAAAHFISMKDQKAQLKLIGELMGEKGVSEEMISALVHLYNNPDKIYMQMKRELAATDTHLLDLKAIEQGVTKETFLQMNNQLFFQKFSKSTLAKNSIATLLSEMA